MPDPSQRIFRSLEAKCRPESNPVQVEMDVKEFGKILQEAAQALLKPVTDLMDDINQVGAHIKYIEAAEKKWFHGMFVRLRLRLTARLSLRLSAAT